MPLRESDVVNQQSADNVENCLKNNILDINNAGNSSQSSSKHKVVINVKNRKKKDMIEFENFNCDNNK
jgi:hypothetical protein